MRNRQHREIDWRHEFTGYYTHFELPPWFTGPPSLRELLETLFDRRYAGVDEEGTEPAPWSQADACGLLVDALLGQGDSVGYRRVGYLVWALVFALGPTAFFCAPNDPAEMAVMTSLELWLGMPDPDVDLRGRLLGMPEAGHGPEWLHFAIDRIGTEPSWDYGSIAEGRDCEAAKRAFVAVAGVLAGPDVARPWVLELLDLCLRGTIVAETSVERRDVWHWLLVQVIPAAWHLQLPEDIWESPA